MFAPWLRSLTVLCLAHAAFSSPDEGQLVQKTIGDSVTIKCRVDVKDQDSLNIKRGLFQTDDLFATNEKNSVISYELRSRLEFDIQAFPSVNITINNLTIEDTGPYWCIYTKNAKKRVVDYGSGSLLLVVKAVCLEKEQCTPEDTRLVLGSLVGMAVLLLVTIMCFLICNIYKTKSRKATRTISNDVYEDMRGTLRR
ncbi:hypothetical protein D4764_18G0006920 [Takifugu flavidus]|uniref:Immunoglobulin domain-containing protein n=1 Tax=Takifugu flavidus TaxID=433684 RepID=A0A5C6NRY3_9TELE|nr:hypothetical protein D4764_18G0006920 [Takifugu flavidus]